MQNPVGVNATRERRSGTCQRAWVGMSHVDIGLSKEVWIRGYSRLE